MSEEHKHGSMDTAQNQDSWENFVKIVKYCSIAVAASVFILTVWLG
jgi:hypothetical protein